MYRSTKKKCEEEKTVFRRGCVDSRQCLSDECKHIMFRISRNSDSTTKPILKKGRCKQLTCDKPDEDDEKCKVVINKQDNVVVQLRCKTIPGNLLTAAKKLCVGRKEEKDLLECRPAVLDALASSFDKVFKEKHSSGACSKGSKWYFDDTTSVATKGYDLPCHHSLFVLLGLRR